MNIKTSGKFAAALAACHLRGKPKPLIVSMYVSFKCNLRCGYCNFPNMRGSELSTGEWLQVIDQLAAQGCKRINFIGGESLMHPGLPAMLERAASHGMVKVISSNGLLVPEKLDILGMADTLVMSLDGVGQAANQVRGPRVWQGLLEAIKAARSINLPFKFNAVISTQNRAGIDRTIDFVTGQLGVGLTVNTVRHGNPGLWKDSEEIALHNEQTRAIFRHLAHRSRTNRLMMISPHTYALSAQWTDYGRDSLDQGDVTGQWPVARKIHCQAGRYFLSLMPNGTAAPCNVRFDLPTERNVISHGLQAVLDELRQHKCVACYAPCLLEKSHLFGLRPQVMSKFLRRQAPRYY